MNYLALKYFHMSCAALSGTLFLARGIWILRASPLLQQRLVRIVPHVVDTLLLASALILMAWSGQYPLAQNWLTAKLIALIAWIGLGTIALKRGKTKNIRTAAFIGALLMFGYIVKVALTHRVL